MCHSSVSLGNTVGRNDLRNEDVIWLLLWPIHTLFMDICFFLKVTLYCKKIAQCKLYVEIHLKMSQKAPEIKEWHDLKKIFQYKTRPEKEHMAWRIHFQSQSVIETILKRMSYSVKSIFELSLGVSCPWSMRCQGSLWRPLFLRFTMGPIFLEFLYP